MLIEQVHLIDDKARYQCHADKDGSEDGGTVEPYVQREYGATCTQSTQLYVSCTSESHAIVQLNSPLKNTLASAVTLLTRLYTNR